MPTGVIKEAPLCECGCGKLVKWNKRRKRWNYRIQYHSTGQHINATNTDTKTYKFKDMDLERVVNSLDKRDRKIMILSLMGLTGSQIGKLVGWKYSAVNKHLLQIKRLCRFWLT